MAKENTSSKNKFPAGVGLIQALIKKGMEKGLDKYQLADEIGITYPYLTALSNGARPVGGIALPKLRRIGEFLEMSFVQVLMLAEVIHPADFVNQAEESIDRMLDTAIAKMREDPNWSRLSPSPEEWETMTLNTRIGMILMFEKVSNQKLINKARMIVLDQKGSNGTSNGNGKTPRSGTHD